MLSYVLPLRHDRVEDVHELVTYVNGLVGVVDEVLVLDGSPPAVFAAHGAALDPRVVHRAPDPEYHFANGKVDGVLTALRLARNERVVIADEDVRWDEDGLRRVTGLLASTDVVRPQNHFDPLPWHARWDTARMLLNRAVAADYPGTLGVRRSVLLDAGGYDGDAMFENLELMRTVRAAGGRVSHAPDLYVRRLPPTAAQFCRQRVRQAFDSFAQPTRLAAELAILPATAAALARRRLRAVVWMAVASIALAERGRRRGGGRAVFPVICSAYAPAWLAERAVCSWVAVAYRLLWGGPRYRGSRHAAGGDAGTEAAPAPVVPLPAPLEAPARRSLHHPGNPGARPSTRVFSAHAPPLTPVPS